jgi:hypothetical protein
VDRRDLDGVVGRGGRSPSASTWCGSCHELLNELATCGIGSMLRPVTNDSDPSRGVNRQGTLGADSLDGGANDRNFGGGRPSFQLFVIIAEIRPRFGQSRAMLRRQIPIIASDGSRRHRWPGSRAPQCPPVLRWAREPSGRDRRASRASPPCVNSPDRHRYPPIRIPRPRCLPPGGGVFVRRFNRAERAGRLAVRRASDRESVRARGGSDGRGDRGRRSGGGEVERRADRGDGRRAQSSGGPWPG